MFAVDLAAAAAVKEAGINPDYIAGFSLGEIAAVAFAGILSYEEAFKLVCRRAELMDKAATENKGAMAAILKLTTDKVEEISLLPYKATEIALGAYTGKILKIKF